MQGNGTKKAGRRMYLAVLLLLLLIGLGRLFMQAPDEVSNAAEADYKAQPEKALSLPENRQGRDMGLVLMDIPTRQAAMAFRVPRTGVYVLSVDGGGPADMAALRPGDCIFKIDGEAVNNAEELIAAFGALENGETAELTVLRGLEELVMNIRAGQGEAQL